MYYYDTKMGVCKHFWYGGCNGNDYNKNVFADEMVLYYLIFRQSGSLMFITRVSVLKNQLSHFDNMVHANLLLLVV